jgi:serine/threonine protein phosphatase PrpC
MWRSVSAVPAGVIAEPEIHTERIGPRDKFVILASDGVWRGLATTVVHFFRSLIGR